MKCLVICIACTLLVPQTIEAKCAVEKYIVRGKVTDGASPVSAARVFVFFDNAEHIGSSLGSLNYPEYSATTPLGSFENVLFFNTFKRSGFWQSDICGKEPSRIDVFVVASGYHAKRKVLTSAEFQISVEGDPKVIRRKVIELSEISIRRME